MALNNGNIANDGYSDNVISSAAGGSVHVSDIDKDGDMDIITTSIITSSSGKVYWHENTMEKGVVGSWSASDITTNADLANSVFAIDVDSDGDIDILSSSEADDKIAWYENNGSESFTARTIATSADGAHSVFAIDLDSDGDIDVLSASTIDDKIAWYENNGSESFTARNITTSAGYTKDVFAIDVDSDGDIDVLSAFQMMTK